MNYETGMQRVREHLEKKEEIRIQYLKYQMYVKKEIEKIQTEAEIKKKMIK